MGLYDKYDPKQARGDRQFRRERIKENQKEQKNINFNLNWIPQERQLRFLEACGLSHPFKYYLGENSKGKPKIYKRENPPDKIQPPEARVIGYGGSAGGGKSDAMLLSLFVGLLSNPGANAGYFRRKFTQLEGPGGAIMRSKELFNDFPGAKWNGSEHMWTFNSLNNSVLKFAHIQHEDNIYDYQSQQFDYIAFDEATQFTRNMYRYLMSRNRVTVNGVYPLFMMGTNPGGVGHQWFKREFVSAGKPEKPHMVQVEPSKKEKHMFIPAKLKDNIVLEDRDAGYRDVLEGMNEIERKRLLEGDWDIHSGQFFPKFSREIHTVEPFEIPDNWKRFISIDYGLDKSAVYWYALDTLGFYYCYKELYMSNLSLSDLAIKIQGKTNPIERDVLSYTVASPDLWNRRQETGKSGRQILVDNGMTGYALRPADDRRVEGWRTTREYIKPIENPLKEEGDDKPEKTSRVLFFKRKVPNLIRCLPALQTSDNDPDDAAKDPHEITHAPESFRYFCMSRPPIKTRTKKEKERLKRKRTSANKPVSNVTGY